MIENKLIIFLPANDNQQLAWALPDSTVFAAVKSLTTHDMAALTLDAAGRDVIVIIPAEDVLLTSAKLPKMSSSRLAQALPFALEEQLVGDIESLHFACATTQADGSMPVAVVTKEKMRQWFAQLQSWNIRVDAFVPAMLAQPYSASAWYVTLGEIAYVRTGLCQGFACDPDNLGEFLNIAMLGSDTRPEVVHVHNYTGSPLHPELKEQLAIQETMFSSERLLADLALKTDASVLNLLQGEFAVKKSRLPQTKKMTQAFTYFAVALVFLLFLYPTVSYFILNQKVGDIDAQIAQIYKRNFPQSASLVAPKMRMQEKLQKLNSQAGDNQLFLLLGYVGKAMQESSSGIALKHMEFQNNQLTLDLTAQSSDVFSAFTDFLTRQGLNVKQQNANLAGTHVNASVVVG